MAKIFRTAIVIEGDSKGGVRAVRATESELKKLDAQTRASQRQTQRSVRGMQLGYGQLTDSIKTAGAAFGVFQAASFVRDLVDANVAMQRINSTFEVVTGSSRAAADEFEFVKQKSNELGLELRSTATQYAQLVAASKDTNLQGQKTRDIFTGVAEAATALHLSSEQTEGALNALQQMISKGNVQAEELRGQLGERLPGAFQLAAQAMGVTTQELNKMLQQGQVTAEDLLPKLARQLHKTFGPQAAKASDNLSQSINRLYNTFFEIESSGNVDELAGSIDGLTATLKDPDTQQGLQSLAQLIIDITSALTDSIAEIGRFASAVKNLDYKGVADFVFQRTGPGYIANQLGYGSLFGPDSGASNAQAAASQNRLQTLGILNGAADAPLIYRDDNSTGSPPSTASHTGNNTGGRTGSNTQDRAAQQIAGLQKQLALYGDLSQAETARISLANGYYGTVTPAQQALILQYARELDARQAATDAQARANQRLADQADLIRGASAAWQDALASQQAATAQVQQDLLTPQERAAQAMGNRAEMIRNSTLSESQQITLLQKNWDQYAATVDSVTGQVSTFAHRARENIQDELGQTLQQSLTGHFDGILDSWGKMLIQMASQAAAANLNDSLFGKAGAKGGAGKGLFGILGGALKTGVSAYFGGGGAANATSLADAGINVGGTASGFGIAGARAAGGPVAGGRSYLVGERGPEIFNPPRSGSIVPNHAIGQPGGRATRLNVQIINQGGAMQERKRERSRGPDGSETIKIYVKNALNEMVGNGEFDEAMAPYNFGRSQTVT